MANRYDYQCIKCNHVQEIEQFIKDNVLSTLFCPRCGKITECIRLITTPPILHFKGDGWTPRYDK